MSIKYMAVALAAASFIPTAASAATTISLQQFANANVSNYSQGGNYPSGSTTINGITFALASYGGGTGIVQLSSGFSAFTVSTPTTAFDTAYIIMNSAFGRLGFNNGSITFNGALGNRTVDIVQGTNIRDHFQGSQNNSATDIFGSVNYNNSGARFDAYRFDLTGLGTVGSIDFRYRNDEPGNGLPFIAGITTAQEAVVVPPTAAVPEPATWGMMLLGFGMVGFGMRRRAANVRTAVRFA